MNEFHHNRRRNVVVWCFNSDARCKAGNYEREARLEGKAGKVDAILFEKQGKGYQRRSET